MRAGEWIDSKVPLLHLAFFAFGGWRLAGGEAILTFGALSLFSSAYLAFGYYLNDLADRDSDCAAGKRKLIASFSNRKASAIAVVLAVISVAACLPWIGRPGVIAALGLAIIGAATYSIGPRLKERGMLGALSSSIAQRILPALVYAAVLGPGVWVSVTYSAWVGLVGLRFILLHQIDDHDADVRSGTVTLVTVRGRAFGRMLITRVIYPLETAFALAMMYLLAPAFPLAMLAGGVWLAAELMGAVLRRSRPAMEANCVLGELILPVSTALNAAAHTPTMPLAAVAAITVLWSWQVLARALQRLGVSRRVANGPGRHTFLDGIDVEGRFVPADEAWRSHYSALQKSLAAGWPTTMPKYGLLKVTTRCNSRCVYCDDWRAQHDDTPLEDVLRGIRSLAEAGVEFLNLSGGEPLLRHDLPAMIAEAKAAGMTTILLTNGILLPDRSRELEEAGLDAVILSLDTLDPATHRRHRGIELDPYLRGLEEVVRMRERCPSMFACVTAVLQDDNLEHIPELLRHVADRGLGVQFSPHHHLCEGRLRPTIPHSSRQRLTALLHELMASRERDGGVNNSEAYLKAIPDFMEHSRLPDSYRCLAGYVALYVDTNMQLKPCWFMPPIGDLRTASAVDLWHSPEAATARASVRSGRCPSCWMLCTAELSLRFAR